MNTHAPGTCPSLLLGGGGGTHHSEGRPRAAGENLRASQWLQVAWALGPGRALGAKGAGGCPGLRATLGPPRGGTSCARKPKAQWAMAVLKEEAQSGHGSC